MESINQGNFDRELIKACPLRTFKRMRHGSPLEALRLQTWFWRCLLELLRLFHTALFWILATTSPVTTHGPTYSLLLHSPPEGKTVKPNEVERTHEVF